LSLKKIAGNCFVLAGFVASVLLPSIAIGEEPNATVSEDPAVGGDEAHLNISVFYATNRRQNGDETVAEIFSGERGEPRYGQASAKHEWRTISTPKLGGIFGYKIS